jgi:hypothetical protein
MLSWPIRYVEPVFRPPSEADSLIMPVTDGCSWNHCTFCELDAQDATDEGFAQLRVAVSVTTKPPQPIGSMLIPEALIDGPLAISLKAGIALTTHG